MKNDWYKKLDKALIDKDSNLFKEIPHTDLHCHSITSAPLESFKKINSDIHTPPKTFKDFFSFNDYIQENISSSIKSIDDFRFIIHNAFSRLVNEGVIYTEMSFDIALPEFFKISEDEYLNIILEEKNKVKDKLEVCIEIGIDRSFDPRKSYKIFKKIIKSDIIGSIDLYGNEKYTKVDDFINIYKLAYNHGLKLKAHVGEIGIASEIKEAVKKLNLNAIQHGIRAIDDKSVIDFLIKKDIVLNICPTSNICLNLVDNLYSHPLRELFEKGLIITINSDDYTLFNTSVAQELINLNKAGIFSPKEIEQLITNGLNQIKV